MVFKQYGFSIAKHKTVIQYEDIKFIPYRLHLDFSAIHLQNESCNGYEQLVTILHERERQFIEKNPKLYQPTSNNIIQHVEKE